MAKPGTGANETLVRIDGRRLRVTNLDKVLYPATGTTKGEVIDYYTRIAPLLIPHVVGRPVTRKRWVEGVGTDAQPGPVFFAKDLEAGAPPWVARMPIEHSGGTKFYPLVSDVPTLVYLAQVASLELHVPQWRFAADSSRGPADRLVLDLDPGPGAGLAECAIVARWARDLLTDMGLEPYPVTSGSKGIHLYAALPAGQSCEQASALAHELARAIEADHSDLVVSSMKKSERTGKVLIDWSQNNGAKTTIAPYSLRGRAHPTVAAPRLWSELDSPDLDQLTFEEVLARTERLGDPMAPLGFPTGGSESGTGPLSSYIAKRSAARTPEPVPSHPTPAEPRGVAAGADRPSFVIQEHHATALHWDFRLERDGVFVSWAVPKGVPPTATRNSLAIMTEDHPLDYGSFEGMIPRGEYGAGTVTIWDHGHYDLEKWRDDEIILTASGAPGGPLGRVRLALIRTDGSGEKSTWLLHRMKTDASGRPQPAGAPVAPRSVSPSPESVSESDVSGHDERVVDGDTLIKGAAAAPAAFRRRAPMLATGSTAGLARAAAHRWRGHATADTAWAEVKWDGIRAIGTWDGTGLRLAARSGTDVTARYPELTGLSARLAAASAIVDGEIVALDARGRPSFTLLQNRMHLSKPREIAREATRTPVKFYLFDVLEFEGRDLTGLPLVERREILESLAANAIADVVVPPVFEDVDAALAASRQFGLEGVMVKNPHSRYRPGDRSEDWLKVKITHTQEVVIGGIRPGRGGRTGSIGSLLVGIPDAEGLRYAGRVGSGFSEAALAQLDAMLTPLRADIDPFVGVPPADASDALWVRPELVGEVEFAEFTPGGILRHARWRGLRSDKAATEVVREV